MRPLLASVAIVAVLGNMALAQATPPAHGRPSETPRVEQQLDAPLARTAPPVTQTPALQQPPSPEAVTPANPLQPLGNVEGSPPPASATMPPPAVPVAQPPLREAAAHIRPETAAYLREIGIDPDSRDVIQASRDKVGAYSLDELAAAGDETKVRRFIYTRAFVRHFLADGNDLHLDPDKYDVGFLTAEEINLIEDELSK